MIVNMLQTTFYKNNNFQKRFVQEWADAGIDLATSSNFIDTCQLDGVTQHVAHDQKCFCVAVGCRHMITEVTKTIVLGPTYKLQEN